MKTKKYKWGLNSYEVYKPKRNKIKLGFIFGFLGVLIITPFTNWLSIPLFKVLNKFPMWIYN